MVSQLRNWVFWPVITLLIITISLNLIDEQWFSMVINQANTWIIEHFNWLFSISTVFMLFSCIFIYFSKLGRVRIGGDDATPLLNKWQWFSITLCTTIATGILFWGTAEPVYHLQNPTHSLGIEPKSGEAGVFALSTLYFHWSFIPYAIYSIPIIAFAIGFYNLKRPYSLISAISVGMKEDLHFKYKDWIDVVSLFALVMGMAASLGGGILTISGGFVDLIGWTDKEINRILVALAIIIAFSISASTGILKGIRILSVLNIYLFVFMSAIFIFLFADVDLFKLIAQSLGQFFTSFFQKSFFTITYPDDNWGDQWTVFNWANWLAWAPVTAMFLGRISVGYTVRQVLLFNCLLPSLFSIGWMSVFGGAAIDLQLNSHLDLTGILDQSGPESIIYFMMNQFTFSTVLITIFIVTIFISFVTAADSNTEAMSALSTKGFGFHNTKSPIWIKLAWGILIGVTAYIMIKFAGVQGIKILSTIGGFPVLFIVITINISLLRYTLRLYRRN